jgi:hypothetical protein
MIGGKRRALTILACVLAAGICAPASFAVAASWAEVGDAGDLPATAQSTFVLGPMPSLGTSIGSITGTLSSSTDRDMYRICKVATSASSATTVGTPGTLSDSQLFLFTGVGLGILANDDDDPSGTLRSTLPAAALPALGFGAYNLAISGFDADPVSVGGLIFPSTPFGGVFGPTGPGGGSPIIGWSGAGQSGTYQINLTGFRFCGGL